MDIFWGRQASWCHAVYCARFLSVLHQGMINFLVCLSSNLAPNEQSSAALHATSAAAGLGGLLDCQSDFLAKRHLKGMAVGIADGGQIPYGRTSVSRAV